MINTLDDIILAADTVIDSVPQISDSTNFWMVRSKQGVFYNEYVVWWLYCYWMELSNQNNLY